MRSLLASFSLKRLSMTNDPLRLSKGSGSLPWCIQIDTF